MAKKKSNNSLLGIIWGILTLAGLVLLIFPTFLSIFERSGEVIGIGGSLSIYLFQDFAEADGLSMAVNVMFVIGLALAAIYMILYVLKACNVIKADISKINKIIAVLELLLFIATLICGLVFASNAASGDIGIASTQLSCGIGFWLGVVGMLVTSVFGYLATKK